MKIDLFKMSIVPRQTKNDLGTTASCSSAYFSSVYSASPNMAINRFAGSLIETYNSGGKDQTLLAYWGQGRNYKKLQ
jgi:hypothetical protein